MDHPLVVHVDQTLCYVAQLQEPCTCHRQIRAVGWRTNKFEPIYTLVTLHKLIDVPI